MRLTDQQIEAIKPEAERFSGAAAQEWQLGSHVDVHRYGRVEDA